MTNNRASKLCQPHCAIVFPMTLFAFVLIACAQSAPQPASNPAGQNALQKYHLRPADLPPPNATPSAMNFPKVTEAEGTPNFITPPGFSVSLYAEKGFVEPRWMVLATNGDVFVSDARSGRIHILRDKNGDGKVDERFIFVTGLEQPFGMAFWKDFFYVANTNGIVRFKYKAGQTQADGAPEKIADLPGKGYNQHWTRNLIFSPDGAKLYATVGSETNVSVEADPRRAAISEYNPDGTGHRIYAAGLRNPVGLAFYPGTRTLWTTVNERDGLGDDLVPDYATSVKEGAFYGWPYSYIGKNEDPRRQGERPDLVSKTVVPDVLIQSHSAALGILFYQGGMFPKDYNGSALVALRGSWNRAKRTGYKIIRIPFKSGKPVGGYEDFIAGWSPDESSREVLGRPVGLLMLKDGSLLITDDGAKKIWRVTYSKSERVKGGRDSGNSRNSRNSE